MSIPQKYEPSTRLIENESRLRTLYVERDLTVREIAEEYAEVGRTMVDQALQQHGITDGEDVDKRAEADSSNHNSGGYDPPSVSEGWTHYASSD